jgi:hypothetical protein
VAGGEQPPFAAGVVDPAEKQAFECARGGRMTSQPDAAQVDRRAALWCGLAAAWSLLFAALHFYWAASGRAGLGAQAGAADAALRQAWFAGYNLIAAALAVLGSFVAVGLARRWGGARLRRLLLAAAAVGCIALILRGALGVVLLLADLLRGRYDETTPVLLVAIEPWFVLGGIAYAGMVWQLSRQPA